MHSLVISIYTYPVPSQRVIKAEMGLQRTKGTSERGKKKKEEIH